MRFDLVYRIKDKLTNTYWTGKDFGTIGKIYVNPKLAKRALSTGNLNERISEPNEKFDLAVVETRIEDQATI